MLYLCLDQFHSLVPHSVEVLEHTQSSLCLHLLRGQVEEDERSRPPHPGTAVDQERGGEGGGVLLPDTADEGDERHGVARDSVIRPGRVQHVCHRQLSLSTHCLVYVCTGGVGFSIYSG